MCGIAGYVRFAGLSPEERGLGPIMAATLRHRGPDETGQYCDGIASLGHARLSIIDLAGGRQPASNEDNSIHVVFNGEIYNHRELADGLRAAGHRLASRCDTEVIAHLYEDLGDAFVERLNGMFAIALWDARRQRLLLIRDRLGIKPIYWHDDGRRIAFGSELKAVLAAADLTRKVDLHALCDYLTFGHVPAPRTIFQAVRKLEPGCLAICTGQGTTVRRWWDVPLPDDPNAASARTDEEWIETFADTLSDAVRLRLVADVPVGAFLSGGVDSATVVAGMRRAGLGPVLTHTVGFDERDHDERARAAQVAGLLNTDHREMVVRPDAAAAVDELAHRFDEPFADPSAVPTFYLSKVARERVTVALAGDGGDELLAGYRRYRFDLIESLVRGRAPSWLRQPTFGAAGRMYPQMDWMPRPLRARRTLQNLACDDVTAHLHSVAIYGGSLPDRLLRPEIRKNLHDYDPFLRGRELFAGYPARDLLNRLLYVDLKTLLPDDMLTKVDRASMAVGLEVRVPLLDYRLVELAARMPTRLKLHRGSNKIVLRRIAARWLNERIAHRPKKGFDVPVDGWFRGPLRELAENLLTVNDARCRDWIDPAAIRRIMTDHQRGARANGHLLWTLLSLELWARNETSIPAPRGSSEGRDHHATQEVVSCAC